MILATDLDRTLLPNGNQEYDSSMPILKKILKDKKIKLAFVTGRNMPLIEEAMKEFDTPAPDYMIAEVGTTILERTANGFEQDKGWIRRISHSIKDWDVSVFRDRLLEISELRLQEEDKQNRFKLSYYLDVPQQEEEVMLRLTRIVKSICPDATIVYSEDETHHIGLIDILPKTATKLTALEYIRKKLGEKKADVIYCGDSGNDILPLTYGYKSVLVRNAIDKIKQTVTELCIQKGILDRLYISQGYNGLNGYYVSGIIEGLIKFGITDDRYLN